MRRLLATAPHVQTESSPRFHIGIVGGGTAGWMAAATLKRRLGCDVTLVESDRVPGVGVGEATIPAMVDWIENMRIDEDEFLRKCGGTYKLAIRFDNWVTPQHRYWHPFGICGLRIDGVDLVHFWKQAIREGWLSPETQYTDFSLQKQLCETLRSPRRLGSPASCANYAFHVDAARFAEYLRELATSEGVAHRIGEVSDVVLGDNGDIRSVHIDHQPPLEADLYLDCSGFSSLLIEKGLGVAWVDWSNQLLCDRAVAVRMPAEKQTVAPYTISTGLDAGWSWQIPLRDVTGYGYVYSSRHLDSDSARRELLQHIGAPESAVSARELKMRIGRRERCWERNCVSIGLSSGFVEPLESTGIFLIQRALDELVDCLPCDASPSFDDARFNRRMQAAYEEIRDFVLLHYIVSQRADTAFWHDATRVSLPDSLVASIEAYRHRGEVELDGETAVFAEANHHFIMLGAGIQPATSAKHRDVMSRFDAMQVKKLLQQTWLQHSTIAESLPSHRCIIDAIHDESFGKRSFDETVETNPQALISALLQSSTTSCLVRA